MVKEVFNKILVPFDDSPHSQKALDYAIRISQSADASLYILSVLDVAHLGITKDMAERFSPFHEDKQTSSDVTERYSITYYEKFEDIKQGETYKQYLNVIAHAKEICKKRKINAETEIMMGPVPETIVQYAETMEIDLIVMGSRGFSGFKRMLMGHVSSDVSEKAHCPVLIIR